VILADLLWKMINRNFEDFPEHRARFFAFLKAVNTYTFGAILVIPPEHQKLVVDSILWAIKHTDRNIAELGLDILNDLLANVGRDPNLAQPFYQAYIKDLISDIFLVMTDRLHKSGFKMHATLLRHMFQLIETGQVTLPLFDPTTEQASLQSNQQYMRHFVVNLLLGSFNTISRPMAETFIVGLFDLKMDLPAFKSHLRDFLIQLKVSV